MSEEAIEKLAEALKQATDLVIRQHDEIQRLEAELKRRGNA